MLVKKIHDFHPLDPDSSDTKKKVWEDLLFHIF